MFGLFGSRQIYRFKGVETVDLKVCKHADELQYRNIIW